MFEKSLTDLIKGVRANQRKESQYVSGAIKEIKEELKSTHMHRKAVAVQKLTYLHMIGYDVSWAAFHLVELMSSDWFMHKRIAYLGAAQIYTPETDVILLTVNLFKKEFVSREAYETCVALNCLSNICNDDLAAGVVSDVVNLLSHSKPVVRKRAALVMYKIFLNFPESLRPSFPRLKEKLDDADPAVQSAVVNVLCELARKNPKNYLALAPILFKLLTSSRNNWMLIKIVKMFAVMCPLEPRLAKKLVNPLTELINTTPAKSLLWECINTVMSGMASYRDIMKLCSEKLREFIDANDQNLRYLGLLGLVKMMKVRPKLVTQYREHVFTCLDDEDVTIRVRALELLTGMANKKHLVDIIRRLLDHLATTDESERSYRDNLIEKIVVTCRQSNYGYVSSFAWYIAVLVELAYVRGMTQGELIRAQLMDVAIRVKSVRKAAVQSMIPVLADTKLLSETSQHPTVPDVLYAAAYIVGEFAEHVDDVREALEALSQPRVAMLPAHVQGVYVQAILKLYARHLAANPANITASGSRAVPTGGGGAMEGDLLGGDVAAPAGAAATAAAAAVGDDAFDPLAALGDVAKEEAAGGADASAPAAAAEAEGEGAGDDLAIFTAPTPDDAGANKDEAAAPGEAAAAATAPEFGTTALQGESLDLFDMIQTRLATFTESTHVEVQERGCLVRQVLNLFRQPGVDVHGIVGELAGIFDEQLNPVAAKAQKKVPVPAGLDLNTPLYESEPESEDSLYGDDDEHDEDFATFGDAHAHAHGSPSAAAAAAAQNVFTAPSRAQVTAMVEDNKRQHEARVRDPFYLPSSGKQDVDVDDIPIMKLSVDDAEGDMLGGGAGDAVEEPVPVAAPVPAGGSATRTRGVSRANAHFAAEDHTDIIMGEEMPEGAGESSDGDESDASEGADALGAVDISSPLRSDEVVPQVQAYTRLSPAMGQPADAAAAAAGGKSKKHRHKKKHRRHHHHHKEGGEEHGGKSRSKSKGKSSRHKSKSKSRRRKEGGDERGGSSDGKHRSSMAHIRAKVEESRHTREDSLVDLWDVAAGGRAGNNTNTHTKGATAAAQTSPIDALLMGDSSLAARPPSHQNVHEAAAGAGGGKEHHHHKKSKRRRGAGAVSVDAMPLFHDPTIDIRYLRVPCEFEAADNKRITLKVRCSNRGSEAVSRVQARLLASNTVKVVGRSTLQFAAKLAPGAVQESELKLTCQGPFESGIVAKGNLLYVMREDGPRPEPRQITLVLHASWFVAPVAIGVAALDALVQGASWVPVATVVKVSPKHVHRVAADVAALLHVQPVDDDAQRMYGRTVVSGHHVVVALRPLSDTIGVDVFSSNETLATNLADEVAKKFQRRK